ncbi:MAG TPA: DUF916 domain-containing protein [Gaiellaceae bacterium]|nr:DUF916 domain-containing protein [Gaiellaceae bacterium]
MLSPLWRTCARRTAAPAGAAVLLAAAAPATAASPPQAVFALRPVTFDAAIPATKSYFVLPAKPGETLTTEVRISNVGSAPGRALLYPVDATTGQTSGAVYLSRAAPRRDVGSWVHLGAASVTLAPGASRTVGFSVQVPPSVRPGQHLGGIVAENATVQGAQGQGRSGGHVGGFRIRIRQLTIVAVQVDLPGPQLARLAVGGIDPGGNGHGYQQLMFGLRNTGTVMVKPTGTLAVTNDRDRRIERAALRLDTVLPRTAIDYPVLVRGRLLPAGRYRASVVLRYAGHETRATRTFTIGNADVAQVFAAPRAFSPPGSHTSSLRKALPWIVAAAGALLAAAGLGVALTGHRRRRPA